MSDDHVHHQLHIVFLDQARQGYESAADFVEERAKCAKAASNGLRRYESLTGPGRSGSFATPNIDDARRCVHGPLLIISHRS
jgi:hypothetical protein